MTADHSQLLQRLFALFVTLLRNQYLPILEIDQWDELASNPHMLSSTFLCVDFQSAVLHCSLETIRDKLPRILELTVDTVERAGVLSSAVIAGDPISPSRGRDAHAGSPKKHRVWSDSLWPSGHGACAPGKRLVPGYQYD